MQGPKNRWILVVTLLNASLVYGFSLNVRIRGVVSWRRPKGSPQPVEKLGATPEPGTGDWWGTHYSERQKGLVVLTTVPFAWGTFEPAVRYVYAMDPPVPGFVFSTGYYLVAAITLGTAAWITTTSRPEADNVSTQDQDPWPILGGTELGLYLFLGNALQVLGLKTVGADRAAFLLQLTTLFVPLLQRDISMRTWGSCLIALMGVAVMGLEGKEPNLVQTATQFMTHSADGNGAVALPLPDMIPSFSIGDIYVVAAAVMYSFHCIRLELYAKSTSAIRLAASKATAETLLSASVATLCVLSSQSASDANPLLRQAPQPPRSARETSAR